MQQLKAIHLSVVSDHLIPHNMTDIGLPYKQPKLET